MSSAWENCAESCNLIFAPTLSALSAPQKRAPGEGLSLIKSSNLPLNITP